MYSKFRNFRGLVCFLTFCASSTLTTLTAKAQEPTAPPTSTPSNVVSSIDAVASGCGVAPKALKKSEIKTLIDSAATDDEILDFIASRARRPFSATEIAEFADAVDKRKTRLAGTNKLKSDVDLVKALSAGPDIYIGWSVLPPKVLRDNYGRYVVDKYFGLDVAVANRASDANMTIIITALEFCHPETDIKDISADPTLVRGSLQKGELTGRRAITSNSIQGIGTILAPAAPFFKNAAHQATYSTGVSLLSPIKSAFDLIWPDTIATYLTNWDKDQVFKQGFVVSGGQSERGRVFIPIEYIYPRPKKKPPENDPNYAAWHAWKIASSGKYDPEEVKVKIGTLVVLGQQAQIKGRVISSSP